MLHDLISAVAHQPRVPSQRLLIARAQSQLGPHHRAQGGLHTFGRRELVVGLVEVQPFRRAAYQTQRRNVACVGPSSAGDVSLTVVRYSAAPRAIVAGTTPGLTCGSALAALFSMAHTLSGDRTWKMWS